MDDVHTQVNIETLILVAVWNQPAIFQGCFKVTFLNFSEKPIFLFFRCEYDNKNREDYVDDNFSPDEYHFSHFYHESRMISLEQEQPGIAYAEYILKYALYKTLLEMRTNQKHKASIDDVAMNAILSRVEPILRQEGAWSVSDEHIGFAVAMDFYPQEAMGQLAVKTLLSFSSKKEH